MTEIDAPDDPQRNGPGDPPDDRRHALDGGPTLDAPSEYRTTPLPAAMRPLVATAFGLDDEPATVGDWMVGFHRRLRAMGSGPLRFDDLCHVDDGDRHVLRADGETWAFHCVFDALLVPFLDDGPEPPLTVESRPPRGGATVTIEMARDGVAATPAGAVLSFGVADSLADEPDAGFDPERAYRQICAYGNAFPRRESYEDWAAGVDGAVTLAVPFRYGVGLARDLALGPPT